MVQVKININENVYNFSNDFIGIFELSKFYESVDMKMNKKTSPNIVLAKCGIKL